MERWKPASRGRLVNKALSTRIRGANIVSRQRAQKRTRRICPHIKVTQLLKGSFQLGSRCQNSVRKDLSKFPAGKKALENSFSRVFLQPETVENWNVREMWNMQQKIGLGGWMDGSFHVGLKNPSREAFKPSHLQATLPWKRKTNWFHLRYFSSVSFRNDFNQRDDETVTAGLEGDAGKCALAPDRYRASRLRGLAHVGRANPPESARRDGRVLGGTSGAAGQDESVAEELNRQLGHLSISEAFTPTPPLLPPPTPSHPTPPPLKMLCFQTCL